MIVGIYKMHPKKPILKIDCTSIILTIWSKQKKLETKDILIGDLFYQICSQ